MIFWANWDVELNFRVNFAVDFRSRESIFIEKEKLFNELVRKIFDSFLFFDYEFSNWQEEIAVAQNFSSTLSNFLMEFADFKLISVPFTRCLRQSIEQRSCFFFFAEHFRSWLNRRIEICIYFLLQFEKVLWENFHDFLAVLFLIWMKMYFRFSLRCGWDHQGMSEEFNRVFVGVIEFHSRRLLAASFSIPIFHRFFIRH